MRLVAVLLCLHLRRPGPAPAETGPHIRIGVLKFGTVSWKLDVMQHHGLAAREGASVARRPTAGRTELLGPARLGVGSSPP